MALSATRSSVAVDPTGLAGVLMVAAVSTAAVPHMPKPPRNLTTTVTAIAVDGGAVGPAFPVSARSAVVVVIHDC